MFRYTAPYLQDSNTSNGNQYSEHNGPDSRTFVEQTRAPDDNVGQGLRAPSGFGGRALSLYSTQPVTGVDKSEYLSNLVSGFALLRHSVQSCVSDTFPCFRCKQLVAFHVPFVCTQSMSHTAMCLRVLLLNIRLRARGITIHQYQGVQREVLIEQRGLKITRAILAILCGYHRHPGREVYFYENENASASRRGNPPLTKGSVS